MRLEIYRAFTYTGMCPYTLGLYCGQELGYLHSIFKTPEPVCMILGVLQHRFIFNKFINFFNKISL